MIRNKTMCVCISLYIYILYMCVCDGGGRKSHSNTGSLQDLHSQPVLEPLFSSSSAGSRRSRPHRAPTHSTTSRATAVPPSLSERSPSLGNRTNKKPPKAVRLEESTKKLLLWANKACKIGNMIANMLEMVGFLIPIVLAFHMTAF